jgi:hypothetical protein
MGAIYWHFKWEDRKEEWLQRPVMPGRLTPTFYDEYVATGKYPDGGFMVPAGTIGYSVMVYTVLAVVAVVFLIFRRKTAGGELGGPTRLTNGLGSLFMVALWVTYISLSIVGRGDGSDE